MVHSNLQSVEQDCDIKMRAVDHPVIQFSHSSETVKRGCAGHDRLFQGLRQMEDLLVFFLVSLAIGGMLLSVSHWGDSEKMIGGNG